MNKDFQKLITRLQDEGISQYGIILLEGFAIDLENKIEIMKKTVKCCSCEKTITDNSHLVFCSDCSGYSKHLEIKKDNTRICYNKDCFFYDKTLNVCVGNYGDCSVIQTER